MSANIESLFDREALPPTVKEVKGSRTSTQIEKLENNSASAFQDATELVTGLLGMSRHDIEKMKETRPEAFKRINQIKDLGQRFQAIEDLEEPVQEYVLRKIVPIDAMESLLGGTWRKEKNTIVFDFLKIKDNFSIKDIRDNLRTALSKNGFEKLEKAFKKNNYKLFQISLNMMEGTLLADKNGHAEKVTFKLEVPHAYTQPLSTRKTRTEVNIQPLTPSRESWSSRLVRKFKAAAVFIPLTIATAVGGYAAKKALDTGENNQSANTVVEKQPVNRELAGIALTTQRSR